MQGKSVGVGDPRPFGAAMARLAFNRGEKYGHNRGHDLRRVISAGHTHAAPGERAGRGSIIAPSLPASLPLTSSSIAGK
jgi:hypothetical protein